MPDDVTEDTPPVELDDDEETTIVALEAMVVSLRDELAASQTRITELEERIASHDHDGYARTEHSHEPASDDNGGHETETPPPNENEPDRKPDATHWYFKRLGN